MTEQSPEVTQPPADGADAPRVPDVRQRGSARRLLRCVRPPPARCTEDGANAASASHSYAAAPGEHVLRLSIVSSLFPHLPHRSRAPFRVAVVRADRRAGRARRAAAAGADDRRGRARRAAGVPAVPAGVGRLRGPARRGCSRWPRCSARSLGYGWAALTDHRVSDARPRTCSAAFGTGHFWVDGVLIPAGGRAAPARPRCGRVRDEAAAHRRVDGRIPHRLARCGRVHRRVDDHPARAAVEDRHRRARPAGREHRRRGAAAGRHGADHGGEHRRHRRCCAVGAAPLAVRPPRTVAGDRADHGAGRDRALRRARDHRLRAAAAGHPARACTSSSRSPRCCCCATGCTPCCCTRSTRCTIGAPRVCPHCEQVVPADAVLPALRLRAPSLVACRAGPSRARARGPGRCRRSRRR